MGEGQSVCLWCPINQIFTAAIRASGTFVPTLSMRCLHCVLLNIRGLRTEAYVAWVHALFARTVSCPVCELPHPYIFIDLSCSWSWCFSCVIDFLVFLFICDRDHLFCSCQHKQIEMRHPQPVRFPHKRVVHSIFSSLDSDILQSGINCFYVNG